MRHYINLAIPAVGLLGVGLILLITGRSPGLALITAGLYVLAIVLLTIVYRLTNKLQFYYGYDEATANKMSLMLTAVLAICLFSGASYYGLTLL